MEAGYRQSQTGANNGRGGCRRRRDAKASRPTAPLKGTPYIDGTYDDPERTPYIDGTYDDPERTPYIDGTYDDPERTPYIFATNGGSEEPPYIFNMVATAKATASVVLVARFQLTLPAMYGIGTGSDGLASAHRTAG